MMMNLIRADDRDRADDELNITHKTPLMSNIFSLFPAPTTHPLQNMFQRIGHSIHIPSAMHPTYEQSLGPELIISDVFLI